MKQFNILLLLLIQSAIVFAQVKEIPLNSKTVFKDINGKQISFDTFIQWTSGGGHEIAPSFDEDGNLLEVFVLEASVAPVHQTATVAGTMPDFEIQDIHHKTYSPSTLQNKVLVLKFWFAACKPCVDEIPQLNKVVAHFQDNPDVVFLAPSLDKTAQIQSFLTRHPFDYAITPDSRQIADQFGVFGYPTHFVINRIGAIEATFSGVNRTIDQKLITAINQALQAQEPLEITTSVPPPPMPDEIVITPTSIIKNEAGEIVSFEDFSKLMREQRFELLNQADSDGQSYILMKAVQ